MISLRLQRPRFEPLFTETQWLTIRSLLELSRREADIARRVFEDVQEQSIAAQLGTSVNTVRTQLKRLYRKLGVRSRVGLVLRIVREHLADVQEAQHPAPTLHMPRSSRKAA